MRVDSAKRNLIDIAAALAGSDRTSFIMDAAYRHAESLILERRLFLLDSAQFDAFEQALAQQPAENNTCLQALLDRPKRWD